MECLAETLSTNCRDPKLYSNYKIAETLSFTGTLSTKFGTGLFKFRAPVFDIDQEKIKSYTRYVSRGHLKGRKYRMHVPSVSLGADRCAAPVRPVAPPERPGSRRAQGFRARCGRQCYCRAGPVREGLCWVLSGPGGMRWTRAPRGGLTVRLHTRRGTVRRLLRISRCTV